MAMQDKQQQGTGQRQQQTGQRQHHDKLCRCTACGDCRTQQESQADKDVSRGAATAHGTRKKRQSSDGNGSAAAAAEL
jgi:hypothetical protein